MTLTEIEEAALERALTTADLGEAEIETLRRLAVVLRARRRMRERIARRPKPDGRR